MADPIIFLSFTSTIKEIVDGTLTEKDLRGCDNAYLFRAGRKFVMNLPSEGVAIQLLRTPTFKNCHDYPTNELVKAMSNAVELVREYVKPAMIGDRVVWRGDLERESRTREACEAINKVFVIIGLEPLNLAPATVFLDALLEIQILRRNIIRTEGGGQRFGVRTVPQTIKVRKEA